MSDPGAFEGLRVVDLSQGMAGPLAAMVLADCGADVLKIEPPGGDWARPFPGFAMWNRGKRSLQLDLRAPSDRRRALELLAGCDVVLDSFRPGAAQRLGVGFDDLRAANPTILACSIDGFGPLTELRDVKAYEGTVNALLGRLNDRDRISGRAISTPPDRPIHVAIPTVSYAAAQLAVQGIAACIVGGITGAHVRTSMLQGAAALLMRENFARDGVVVPPSTVHYALERLCFLTAECADGRWIQMCARQDHHFKAWLQALDLAHVLDDPIYARAPMGIAREEDIDRLEDLLRARMRTRPQHEWMRLFIEELDVGADPFLSAEEFLSHPQMVENGRVADLDDPERGHVRQPGPLAIMSRTPMCARGPAPKLDEHAAAHAWRAEREPPAGDGGPGLPLEGITVLECAYFIAGPLGLALLAELGARVIKVEPLEGDSYRRTGVQVVKMLAGKESVAIDLKTPEGRAILHRLVARADALVHSFRPGVPERLGLDAVTLAAINPALIHHYGGSYGSKGPQSHRAAFHSTPTALSSAGIVQAGEGNPPVDEGSPDPVSGLGLATALAVALAARKRFGVAQTVETTMLASMAHAFSNELVLFDGRPDPATPDAGQHGPDALHRLYEAADGYLHLEVMNEREWTAFAEVFDSGGLAGDDRFGTAEARRRHDRELTARIAAVCAASAAGDVAAPLTKVGVACVAVHPGTFEDFLVEKGLVAPREHPEFGPYWHPLGRVTVGERAPRLGAPASVGEHTVPVLRELGCSESEIGDLLAAGVIGSSDALRP